MITRHARWARHIASLLCVGALAACASLNQEDEDEDMELTSSSEREFDAVAFEAKAGLADYKAQGESFQAEWIRCSRKKKAAATILVMHGDQAGYDRDDFCGGWVAQSFLSQRFNVITVNRPGFARSNGIADFVGDLSLAALEAGVDAAKRKKSPPVEGIWGYSSGATAAVRFARKMADVNFLILGGGVYDLTRTLYETKDNYLKKDIGVIKKTGGEDALYERSVAYDVGGLPKHIAIYHGKKDKAVAPSQAESFSDTLISSEYDADLQMLKGVGHDIPWKHHRKILEILAHSQLKRLEKSNKS